MTAISVNHAVARHHRQVLGSALRAVRAVSVMAEVAFEVVVLGRVDPELHHQRATEGR